MSDTIQKPANGSISFSFNGFSDDARVIAYKLKSTATDSRQVVLLFNSIPQKTVPLGPNDVQRIFVVLRPDVSLQNRNVIQLSGNGSDWQLERMEIRNSIKEGDTFRYLLLPKGNEHFVSPSPLQTSLLFLFLFLFGLFFPLDPLKDSIGKMHFTISCIAAVFFIAILVLPVFSQFELILYSKRFFALLLLVFSIALFEFYRAICRKSEMARPGGGLFLHSALILLLTFLFFFSEICTELNKYGNNFSGLLHISTRRAAKAPFLTESSKKDLVITPFGGYDGQFFYLMTFDPFLSRFQNDPLRYKEVVDVPSFRYRRIGFSVLTKIFSLDTPGVYPQIMLAILLFSQMLTVFLITRMAVHFDRNPFWALCCLLIPGFVMSTRVATPECLAAAFLVGGILFYFKKKHVGSVIWFAFSLLVRETGMIVVFAIVLFEFLQKNKRLALVMALAVVPYFFWRGFVTWRLFQAFGWYGFFYEPQNLSMPFLGIAHVVSAVASKTYLAGIRAAGILFPLLLTLILVISAVAFWQKKNFLTFSILAYSAFAVSLSFKKVWVHVGNAERQTYEPFLLLLILFLSFRERIWLKYVYAVFCALLFFYDFFFFSVFDSFRAGLRGLFPGLWG